MLNLNFRANCSIRLITWLSMWEPKVFSASVLVQPKSDCALYNYGLKFDLFEKFSNTESCGIKLPVRRCSNSSR